MTYEEFLDSIRITLKKFFPEKTEIKAQKITKNNGVVLNAIYIHEPETNLSPTLYMDYFYNAYKNGESIDYLAAQIRQFYLENKPSDSLEISSILDFDTAKPNIVFVIQNKDKNSKELPDIPHLNYLDLVIFFEIRIFLPGKGYGSVKITNEILKIWNKTAHDIFKYAFVNTPKLLPPLLIPMSDFLMKKAAFLCDLTPDFDNIIKELLKSPFYLLTNEEKSHGASTLLYPDIFEDFASKVEDDFYIIPSSIHELLLIPARLVPDKSFLLSLVKEVNETQLEPQEILSDTLYFYSREIKRILY